MTIAVQGVVFRALPGDRGLGAATDPTSKNNGLPCLTRDLAQGNDEFWGNCARKESVTLVTQCPLLCPPTPPPTNEGDATQAQSSTENPRPQATLECPEMPRRPTL